MKITLAPPLPTNEGHSSRVQLELKDLPGHSAVTIRLAPQTFITPEGVGASLIMQLEANNARLYLPSRPKHPCLLLQRCSRQWEMPASSHLHDYLQGYCSPRLGVCAGQSFSLVYTIGYKTSSSSSTLCLLNFFIFLSEKPMYSYGKSHIQFPEISGWAEDGLIGH